MKYERHTPEMSTEHPENSKARKCCQALLSDTLPYLRPCFTPANRFYAPPLHSLKASPFILTSLFCCSIFQEYPHNAFLLRARPHQEVSRYTLPGPASPHQGRCRSTQKTGNRRCEPIPIFQECFSKRVPIH